jgi:hypothetical protein
VVSKIDVPDFFSDFHFGDGSSLVPDKVFHQGKLLGVSSTFTPSRCISLAVRFISNTAEIQYLLWMTESLPLLERALILASNSLNSKGLVM